MKPEIIIRTEIKPGDLGSIVKLHGEYYRRHNGFDCTFEPYVAIPLSEFVLRGNNREGIWIAEEKTTEDIKELAGCIAITKNKEDLAQLRWYLLKEEYQGLGLGKDLILQAINFAGDMGYRRIILWTVSELPEAIRIYERNGFKLTEEKEHRIWGRELIEQCYEKVLE